MTDDDKSDQDPGFVWQNDNESIRKPGSPVRSEDAEKPTTKSMTRDTHTDDIPPREEAGEHGASNNASEAVEETSSTNSRETEVDETTPSRPEPESESEDGSNGANPDTDPGGDASPDEGTSEDSADPTAEPRDSPIGENSSTAPTDESAQENGENDERDDGFEEVVPELNPDVYRAPFEGFNVNDPEDLADAVAQIDSQAAVTIEGLLSRVQKLEGQVKHYEEEAKKARQEFQNFKKRKETEAEELKDVAAKDFIKEALPIRDNLQRALNHDTDDIRSGVELIKEEFDELLQQEGVTIIQPDAGDEVDPSIHEVMTRVESDVPEGQIDECFRPGYEIEGHLIRPARVTVSDGSTE